MECKIFLIGPDRAAIAGLVRDLAEAGYRVIGSADGLPEARKALADGGLRPDAILLDAMPDDGISPADAFRSLEPEAGEAARIRIVEAGGSEACRPTPEEDRKRRLRCERGLSACSRALLVDSEEALVNGLRPLLDASECARIFFYRNAKDADGRLRARRVVEISPSSAGSGGETARSADESLDYEEGFRRWRDAFEDDRPIQGTLAGLPAAERKFFSGEAVRSVLLLPVREGERWHGFIGFVDAVRSRVWDPSEVTLLKTAAEMIGVFLDRRRIGRALEEDRLRLVERVAERTRELERANRELTRAARLKDEFLANMSHELRTPLTAVLGLAEALRDRVYGELNEKQIRALETIERSGAHLLALINDILDISRIEAGKLELEILPVSPAGVCEAGLRMVRGAAEKKRVTLVSRLEADPGAFPADERRLRQILVNLLSNAVKFTPEGGMVTLTVAGDSERIRFSIRDTGIGIAPEDMERIFEPFTQLDGGFSRFQEGTGLGLALVRRLIHLHGGDLSVESEPGEGSVFTVALPRAFPKAS
jgi:signal transduction histidine kinase/CheY-like chemotaxis protein